MRSFSTGSQSKGNDRLPTVRLTSKPAQEDRRVARDIKKQFVLGFRPFSHASERHDEVCHVCVRFLTIKSAQKLAQQEQDSLVSVPFPVRKCTIWSVNGPIYDKKGPRKNTCLKCIPASYTLCLICKFQTAVLDVAGFLFQNLKKCSTSFRDHYHHHDIIVVDKYERCNFEFCNSVAGAKVFFSPQAPNLEPCSPGLVVPPHVHSGHF